ncbi:MAG TPA: bifunctional riboflavin kinase/FAD synthetase [Candidatus Saccharicenans sp.]|nr:bifunctional riboflavin kinase/FAD synthetase [Candidatus Saccharicenans sp.]HPU93463.1 bifunctional riboflavin kinase/FAD synthetase [Candidatus Saccharicenans sp.]
MKVFHHLSGRVRPQTAGSVLAIGIFDGFHRGHQKIIKKVKAEASSKRAAAGVLSFYPHPEKALNGRPIKMIQTLEQRLRSFERAGLDFCLLFDLDNGLSRLSGEEFARQIIKDSLGIQQVVVGRNFRFGHQRQCGVNDLKKFGHLFGFKVTVLEPARSGGRPISSSLIRKLLESGQIEEANKLLGHPYEISGRVVSGDRLGQRLGFPTINLKTENEITPGGVFITLTEISGKTFPSVSNIGIRPTVGGTVRRVESHLLDIKLKVYRQKASLFLLKKIREEKKFDSVEALKEAMARDINLARKFFKGRAGRCWLEDR